jgi:hypothetical protein
MENGAIFPAGIGYQKKGKIILCAGNQRVAAAEVAHRASFPIYVLVNPNRLQILDLTATNNNQHGLSLHYEERLAHAAEFVAEGSTRAAAAAKFNVLESRLGSYIRQKASRNRLMDLHVPEPKDKMKLERIGAIKSDKTAIAAARVADMMSTAEFDQMVTGINRCRSEAAELQYIANTVARLETERKVLPVITTSTRVLDTYDRIWRYVKSSEKLPGNDKVAEIDIHLVPILRDQIERTIQRLNEIIENLP